MAGHWPTADEDPSSPDFEVEFARIWKGLKKVVFSRTLTHVQGNATLVREVSAAEIKRMKEEPGKDMEIGGAHLAATFMRLDLIDEYQVFFHPVVLGGGTPMFPALPQPVELRLLETRAFGSGVLYVRYGRA